jgi:hypothetical protein
VVAVPVGEVYVLDGGEVGAGPGDVFLEDIFFRAGVEEEGVCGRGGARGGGSGGGYEEREAVGLVKRGSVSCACGILCLCRGGECGSLDTGDGARFIRRSIVEPGVAWATSRLYTSFLVIVPPVFVSTREIKRR